MNALTIKSDRIVTAAGLLDGFIRCEGGTIAATGAGDPGGTALDCTGKYVSAGFIELHSHGGGGFDFLSGDASAVAAACDFHLRHGVTTILPTVSAAPFDRMERAVAAISAARRKRLTAVNIPGAHLEGPYLSPGQCGAQCADFITPPDKEQYERLTKAYGGDIARWTYAPERDTDGAFCRHLVRNGILPSAGHTDAVYADMRRAAEDGCTLVTHLYSCTSTVTRAGGFRRMGVTESALYLDELYTEIIADGKHLPPELIRMIVKIKGREKVPLVTDSLPIAGTDAVEGVLRGTPYIVEDGVCKLKDRSAFAGSVATACDVLRVMTGACGFPLCDAVYMMTAVPAAILGLNKGRPEPGYDADLAVFDDNFCISDVFVGGTAAVRGGHVL